MTNSSDNIKSEDVVFLEDLEPKKDEELKNSQESTSSATKNTKASLKTAAVTGKRQRTLMEMMGSGTPSVESAQPRKKVRVEREIATKAVNFGLQPLNSIPFSSQAFVDSLTDEQKKYLDLECQTMGKSWLKLLKDEIKKPYFVELKKFLWSEGVQGPKDKTNKVFPIAENIYAWSKTPLGRVRVVIIGQDPYHGPGQAHGLCFSVPHGIPIPPSLRNIYAEIRSEYPDFEPPKHGNLSAWANSGVLLLNTALTVRNGSAGSHSKKGWETFTDKVIEVVDKYGGASLGGTNGVGRGIVFMAWGAWAQKRVEKLDKKKHLILQSAHPSPLSASRGFMGNGHFKKANDWLEARYGKDGRIDWCTLDVVKPVELQQASQDCDVSPSMSPIE